jgi:hypothetical protein
MKVIGVDSVDLPKTIKIEREAFLSFLRTALRGIQVDEVWYRRVYPDVDSAIKDGTYKSAKHHFVENGYFEGRKPSLIVVDEKWYKAAYPDIAEGIELGDIRSAQSHFEDHGYDEGRFPSDV